MRALHLAATLGSLCTTVTAIWPQPKFIVTGNSTLWFSKELSVTYNGAHVATAPGYDAFAEMEQPWRAQYRAMDNDASMTGSDHDTIINAAVKRTIQLVNEHSIVPWKLLPRHSLSDFEPSANVARTFLTSLQIENRNKEQSIRPSAGEVDESYNLTITEDGQASLLAESYIGVLHGLQTLSQVFFAHSSQEPGGIYTNMAPIIVRDAPKFAHRGLNMDVARNWFPVDTILKAIDAMSWNKFNRLHLHVTDSQSWPLDIPSMPELSAKGAYQPGLSYTPADLDRIQRHGVERGVQVVLEIDVPGHTTSIAYSHPNLIAAAYAEPWPIYCNEPPCGTLKLNHPDVETFLKKLFADLLPRVSAYTSYFHTGGDEVNAQSYTLDDSVGTNDTAVIAPLLQNLLNYTHQALREAGLAPIVWEEMLLHWNLTLGSDVVIQSWLSDESVARITSKGHKVIAGNHNYWYLDCGRGQWFNTLERSFTEHFPFVDWCPPSKSWRLVYSYDPLASVPAEQQHLVLGGDVHIWAEQTDSVNFDDMVWPRASAAGEVLWSGRQDEHGRNRTQMHAAPRLAEWRERMVARGITAGPVQMVYCTQGDAETCSL